MVFGLWHCFCSLLANSALIMRFASLRAEALGSNPAYRLYGNSLRADSSQNPAVITGTNEEYKRIAELELRSSGVIGIEVRSKGVMLHILSTTFHLFFSSCGEVRPAHQVEAITLTCVIGMCDWGSIWVIRSIQRLICGGKK